MMLATSKSLSFYLCIFFNYIIGFATYKTYLMSSKVYFYFLNHNFSSLFCLSFHIKNDYSYNVLKNCLPLFMFSALNLNFLFLF